MDKHPLPPGDGFQGFSLVCLNSKGRFVEPGNDKDEFSDGQEIEPAELPDFLRQKIVLPPGVTDVFLWVHGWRNTHATALASAKRIFHGIQLLAQRQPPRYPRVSPFVPAYLVVRWPSQSWPTSAGYHQIRDRAAALTEQGDAEFFLASLLGYLDHQNQRLGGHGSKTLAAKGGFYVHCVGHSFGGRFLTAAITAAAAPQARTLSLLNRLQPSGRLVLGTSNPNRFQFTVDSLLVFQMAAPCRAFAARLKKLVYDAPLRGPLVATYSHSDTANCTWHWALEHENGIGCSGVEEPGEDVATMDLPALDYVFQPQDFSKPIVNISASHIFNSAGLVQPEGAHSDFYYEESVHLLLSLVNHLRS